MLSKDTVHDEFVVNLEHELQAVKEMLISKNRKYGNSALEPIRVFSKASNIEQINVRIDDKLSRLVSSQSDEDEDVDFDLIGYLLIRRIAKKLSKPTISDSDHEILKKAFTEIQPVEGVVIDFATLAEIATRDGISIHDAYNVVFNKRTARSR